MQILNLLTYKHTHNPTLFNVDICVHIELRLLINCMGEKIEYRNSI